MKSINECVVKLNSGVYCIKNILNNKKYIGQSNNLKRRIAEHFRVSNLLNKSIIHNAIKKYTKKNFKVQIKGLSYKKIEF